MLGELNTSLSCTPTATREITINSTTSVPNTASVSSYWRAFDLYASINGGTDWFWIDWVDAPTFYVMPGLGTSGQTRYDLGLEKVALYANGRSLNGAIATAVSSGIDGDIFYDPNAMVGGHILNAYSNGRALCLFNARLMEYLMDIAGVPAGVQWIWGGSSTQRQHYNLGTSVQFQCGAHDAAGANPHFTYHAVTTVAGGRYDPSYGTSNVAPIICICKPYTPSGPGGAVTCNPASPAVTPTVQLQTAQWTGDFPTPCNCRAP